MSQRARYDRRKTALSPPHQSAANHNHWRCLSVSAFMGSFSPEDIITVAGVSENQRQHDDRADQQQGLGFGCSCRLAEGNLEGHDIRPRADRDAEIARQKYPEAQ